MENMRNIIKLRVTTNEKDFLQYAVKPTFVSRKIYGEDFNPCTVIHEKRVNKTK